MRFKRGVGLIVVLFLITSVSASFQVGNLSHFIATQYNPSEKISGWINISLEDESADSLFEDSNNNSVTLSKLIEGNEYFEYSCVPKSCAPGYTPEEGGQNLISFSLNSEQEKLVGIKLKGDIKYINSLNLSISSNAGASCYSQIGIDFLNDGSIDFTNKKKPSGGNSCELLLSRGCFKSNQPYQNYSIGNFPSKHCQKITFSPSPSFKIGAWISNTANDPRTIKMAVYNLNMEEIENANCNLPSIGGAGDNSCEVDLYVKESTPYFVCIYSNKTGNSKLRGYSDNVLGCGFYQESENNPEENAAFDIFAQALGFGAVDEILISDSSEDTMNKIKNYIFNQYGTYNCAESNCIIPFSITSKMVQEITLKNLKLEYTTNLGATETKEIYSVKETPYKISSEFQKMYISYGNFTVPEEYGEKLYKLNLGGIEIFSKNIKIKDFPKITYLYPLLAPSIVPVNFVVYVNSSKNITEYSWDFNDSTPIQKTTTNKITHTFNSSGVYYVRVSAKDSEGLNVSKTFVILSTIPKEQISSELEKRLNKLTVVKNSISKFDLFTQNGLNSIMGIKVLEEKLKSFQKEYTFASSEEDYASLIRNISLTEVPESIAMTKKSPFLPFFPMTEQIDLDTLKSVGGETDYIPEKAEEYKNALLGWQMQNAKVKVSMEGFSSIVGRGEKPVLSKLIINIEKNYSEKPVYLFLKKMRDLKFKENYLEKESGDYFYWELKEDITEIEFLTSEIINYEELPAFVSPEISELVISEKVIQFNFKENWWVVILALIVLFVVATVVYTILSIWYKRKYESYLFKNRNDLYNLISYVNISKKKGEKEENITSNLKKSRWTGEQITYVLKKYSGRRTGMIELPLTKLVDKIMRTNEKPKPQPPGMRPGINPGINPQNRNFLNGSGKVL